MINPKDILKMAKATFRHGQGYPERRLLHPYREWLIGISIFSMVLIVGSISAGLLFAHYQNIDERMEATEKRIPTYQAGAVSDVLELYQARREAFEALQAGAAPATAGSSTDTGISGSASSSVADMPANTSTATNQTDSPSAPQAEAEIDLPTPPANDTDIELAN